MKAKDASLQTVRVRTARGLNATKVIKRPRRFSYTWYISSLLGEKLNTSRRYASNKKIWVNITENDVLRKYGYILANILFCDIDAVYVHLSSEYFYCFIEKEASDLFSTVYRVPINRVCLYQNSHLLAFNYNNALKTVERTKYLRNRRCHRWNFAQFEEINLGLLTHFVRNELQTFENPFLSFGKSLLFAFDSNKYFEKRRFSDKGSSDTELFSFLRKLYYSLKNEDQGVIVKRLVNGVDTSILSVMFKYFISLEVGFNTAQTYSQSEYEDDRRTVNTENLHTTRRVRKKSLEVFDAFHSEALYFSQSKLLKKFNAVQSLNEKLLGSLCPKTGKILHSSSLVLRLYFDVDNQSMQDVASQVADVDLKCLVEERSCCLFGVFYDLIEEESLIKKYLTHVEGYRERRKLDLDGFRQQLKVLEFTEEEVEDLIGCLKLCVFFQNIRIKKLNETNYLIKSNKCLKKAVKLLNTTSDELKEFITTELTSGDDVEEFLDQFFLFLYQRVVSTVFSKTEPTDTSLRVLEVFDSKGIFEQDLLAIGSSEEQDIEALANIYRFESLNKLTALELSALPTDTPDFQSEAQSYDYWKLRVSRTVIEHSFIDYNYYKTMEKHLSISTPQQFTITHFNSYALKTIETRECHVKYNVDSVAPFTELIERFLQLHQQRSCLKVLILSIPAPYTLNESVCYKSILTVNSRFDLAKQFSLYGVEKLLDLHSLNPYPIVRSLFYIVDTFFMFGLISRELHSTYLPLYGQMKQQQNFNSKVVAKFVKALLTEILGEDSENNLWFFQTEFIMKVKKQVVYLKHAAYTLLLKLRVAVRESAVLKIYNKFSFVFKRQYAVLKIQRFVRAIVLKPHVQYRTVSRIVSLYFSFKVKKDVKAILRAVKTIQSFLRMVLVQYSYKNRLNKVTVIVKVQSLFRKYRVKKKFDVIRATSLPKQAVLKPNEFILFTTAVVDVSGLNTLYELILTSSKRLLVIDLKSNLINLEVEHLHYGKNVVIRKDKRFSLDCVVVNGKYYYYDILNKDYKTFHSRVKSTNLSFSACLRMDNKALLSLFNYSFMYSAICKKKNRHRTKGLIKSKNKLIILYNSKVYWLNLKLFQLERKSKQSPFLLNDDFSFSFEASTISNDSLGESKQNRSLVQLLSSDVLLKSLSITVDIKLRMDAESTIELQNVLTLNKTIDYLRFRTYSVRDRNTYKRFILLAINLQKRAFVQDRARAKPKKPDMRAKQLVFIHRGELSKRIYETVRTMRENGTRSRSSRFIQGLYYEISSEEYIESHSPLGCRSRKRYRKHIRRIRKRIVKRRYRNNLYLQYVKNKHKFAKSKRKDEAISEEGTKMAEGLKKILLELRKKMLIDKFKLFGILTVEQAKQLTATDYSKKLGLRNKIEVEELQQAFQGFDTATEETAVEKLRLALLNVKLSKYLTNFTSKKFGNIDSVLALSNQEMRKKFGIEEDAEVVRIRQVFTHYSSFKAKYRVDRMGKESIKWPEQTMYSCPECKKQYKSEFETCVQCGYFNNKDFENRRVPSKLWCCNRCRRWNRLASSRCENVFCSKQRPEDDLTVTEVSEWYSNKSNMRFFDKQKSLFQFDLVKEVDQNAKLRRKMYSKGDFVRYVNIDGKLNSKGVVFSAFGFISETLTDSQEYSIIFETTGADTETTEVVVPHRDIELVPQEMLESD